MDERSVEEAAHDVDLHVGYVRRNGRKPGEE